MTPDYLKVFVQDLRDKLKLAGISNRKVRVWAEKCVFGGWDRPYINAAVLIPDSSLDAYMEQLINELNISVGNVRYMLYKSNDKTWASPTNSAYDKYNYSSVANKVVKELKKKISAWGITSKDVSVTITKERKDGKEIENISVFCELWDKKLKDYVTSVFEYYKSAYSSDTLCFELHKFPDR